MAAIHEVHNAAFIVSTDAKYKSSNLWKLSTVCGLKTVCETNFVRLTDDITSL